MPFIKRGEQPGYFKAREDDRHVNTSFRAAYLAHPGQLDVQYFLI
jgi:hypothetical protein